jgi:hypothetical protein
VVLNFFWCKMYCQGMFWCKALSTIVASIFTPGLLDVTCCQKWTSKIVHHGKPVEWGNWQFCFYTDLECEVNQQHHTTYNMNSRFLPQLHDANDALWSRCICDSECVSWRKYRVPKDCKCKYMLIVWWEATSLLKPRLNHDKTWVRKCISSNPCSIPNLNALAKRAKLGTIPWSRVFCGAQTSHSLAPFSS